MSECVCVGSELARCVHSITINYWLSYDGTLNSASAEAEAGKRLALRADSGLESRVTSSG